MVKKSKSLKEVQETSKTKPVKKASVGAWWQSAAPEEPSKDKTVPVEKVAEEVIEQAPKQSKTKRSPRKQRSTEKSTPLKKESVSIAKEDTGQDKQARKPGRRGRRKKAEDPVSKDKATETVPEKVEVEVQEKEKKKPARRGRPRKKPVSDTDKKKQEKKETKKPEAKPARKRPGRKKKSVEVEPVTAEEQKVPSDELEEKPPEVAVQKEPTETFEDKEPAVKTPSEDQQPEEVVTETEIEQPGKVEQELEEKVGLEVEVSEDLEPESRTEPEPEPKPVIKLLINAEEPEECRLALVEDGRLESIHVATVTRTQTKNNIYKAKIVAIEPNLQAAFVDYGTDKNGFLPFSEIHPEYYKGDVTEKVQQIIDDRQWKKLSITDVVEKGTEILVQVVKEEVGKKGANMTTYLSLPGRCIVLMPGSDSTGISRKISGEERRSQLREYLLSMDIPEGIGWIVRTASIDITKAALKRDVTYLLKLWDDIKEKGQELEGVGLIYQDHDHVLRFLREHFDPDIQEIQVDDKEALEQVKSFVELLPAKQRNVKCKLHRGSRPIFNQYSIEDQIESIYQPKVNLPSGGSIVINPTEALVAIDVNSGSTAKGQNFEETIFQANMEAAKELARQLRLRDLGGLVVVDFIDMRSKKHVREVEKQVKVAMKRDKAKVDFSRISKFGLMQISRQKLGAPIEVGNYRVCTHCKGRGMVRSVETLALYYLRRIHTGATRKMVYQVECRFPLDVAQYLLNNKRSELRELELKYNSEVIIIADPKFRPAENEIVFHKMEKDENNKKDKSNKKRA